MATKTLPTLTLRDKRQAEFANSWLSRGKYGILYLCPRFGKIYTTINILETMDKNARVLIAYPDLKIKEAWETDFKTRKYKNPNITYTTHMSLKKYTDQIYDFVSKNLSRFSNEMFDYDVLSLMQGGHYVDAPLLSNSAFPAECKDKFEALIKQIEGRKRK